MITVQEKINGMFLGIAIGDALGAPTELMSKENIVNRYGRLKQYIDSPTRKGFDGQSAKAGGWTDDTQLTLAVADSLIESKKFDMHSMAKHHVFALDQSTCGWGGSTREAVKRLKTGVSWKDSGKTEVKNRGLGNGVAMKVAPLGVVKCLSDKLSIDEIVQFAIMTHQTRIAVESALVHAFAIQFCLKTNIEDFKVGSFINAILSFLDKNESALNKVVNNTDLKDRIYDRLKSLFFVDYLSEQDAIDMFNKGGCYVYDSLPLSYYYFLKNPNEFEAVVDAANGGGDTDTNASMVGSLVGALNGSDIFPEYYVTNLKDSASVLDRSKKLYEVFSNDIKN